MGLYVKMCTTRACPNLPYTYIANLSHIGSTYIITLYFIYKAIHAIVVEVYVWMNIVGL